MNISTLIDRIEQWQSDPITDTIFILSISKKSIEVLAHDCKAKEYFKIDSEDELDVWYRRLYENGF
jgi:hypothetical protein